MSDLKPCPFCGSPASRRDDPDGAFVACECDDSAYCGAQIIAEGDEGVEQWNRRALPALEAAVVKAAVDYFMLRYAPYKPDEEGKRYLKMRNAVDALNEARKEAERGK